MPASPADSRVVLGVRGREIAIGQSLGEDGVRHVAVQRQPFGLAVLLIPAQPEPLQTFEDGVERSLGVALDVGVVDAQDHRAAVAAGVEPVKDESARTPNVQKARGGGRKAEPEHGNFSIAWPQFEPRGRRIQIDPDALLCLCLSLAACAAAQRKPDLAAQREAMKKLSFLAGKWSGNALVTRGPGEPLRIRQSEEVQYKLDGLALLVEGTGRNAEGQIVFQALAVISYDEAARTYRFRSYNDGRYLDTELKVSPRGFAWGFAAGPVRVNNAMRINEKGESEETTEAVRGSAAPMRMVEMKLERQP